MTALDLDGIRKRLAYLAPDYPIVTESDLDRVKTTIRTVAFEDAPALLAALDESTRVASLMAQSIANHTAAAGDEWEEGVRATLAWLRTQIEQRKAFAWYIAVLLDEAETALLPPPSSALAEVGES